MQRLLELHDGDGDGVILHEEFLSALCAIRKLASGNPQERLACEHATPQDVSPQCMRLQSIPVPAWQCITSPLLFMCSGLQAVRPGW
jgi:hypothetical protein